MQKDILTVADVKDKLSFTSILDIKEAEINF
jgi:hypothetical protein